MDCCWRILHDCKCTSAACKQCAVNTLFIGKIKRRSSSLFRKTQYRDMLDDSLILSSPRGKIHSQVKSHNEFRHGPQRYFEFSHFDPSDCDHRKILQRRIDRMIALRKSRDPKVFVYSHRSANGYQATTGSRILSALLSINNLYMYCRSISITQHLVERSNQRGIKIQKVSDQIIFYTIYSNRYWCGDPNIFFALHDDDLLSVVFSSCAKIFGFPPSQSNLL